jgi:hypothetical protein
MHSRVTSANLDEAERRTRGPNRLRVQLDFSEDAFDRVEELRREIDAASKADVIREAIRVYEWLAEQAKEGRFIEVQDRGGQQISRVEAKWFLR